jgi:hypothetical protein
MAFGLVFGVIARRRTTRTTEELFVDRTGDVLDSPPHFASPRHDNIFKLTCGQLLESALRCPKEQT